MDDVALLAAVRAGDERAFTELVRRYHDLLIATARYYVRNATSAEDVAQETWIAVIRGIERFEGRSSLKTWLLRILVNRARTHGVKEAKMVATDFSREEIVAAERFDQGGAWREAPVPFTESIDDLLTNAPFVREVHAAIERLAEPARLVVTLRDREGLSTSDVAEILGISDVNVRVILHRGRAKVRAEVENKLSGGRS